MTREWSDAKRDSWRRFKEEEDENAYACWKYDLKENSAGTIYTRETADSGTIYILERDGCDPVSAYWPSPLLAMSPDARRAHALPTGVEPMTRPITVSMAAVKVRSFTTEGNG